MTDARTALLAAGVASLRDVEGEILAYLGSLDEQTVAALPAGLAEAASERRDVLVTYLRAGDHGVRATTSVQNDTVAVAGPASVAAVALYARHSHAAIAYAALFEMSLRLYDPRLREIAPRHLDETAQAASELAEGLARLVSDELAGAGLDCHCVCPMCSLGACGCVSVGHDAAVALSYRDGDAPGEGFDLQRPRPASQLADAGVVAGDRLLAIDGEAVTTVSDVQGALRRHDIGERVELLVAHGAARRHLEVTHVDDY